MGCNVSEDYPNRVQSNMREAHVLNEKYQEKRLTKLEHIIKKARWKKFDESCDPNISNSGWISR